MSSVEEVVMVPNDGERVPVAAPKTKGTVTKKGKKGRPVGSRSKRAVQNSPKEVLNKKMRSLLIAFKLAPLNVFNEEFEILNEDGSPVEGSNVVDLIEHSLTSSKNLKGLDLFIDYLKKARVNSSLFLNNSIKDSLNRNTAQVIEPVLEPQEPHSSKTDNITSVKASSEEPKLVTQVVRAPVEFIRRNATKRKASESEESSPKSTRTKKKTDFFQVKWDKNGND